MRMLLKNRTINKNVNWKKYLSLVFFAIAFVTASYGQCSMSCDDEIQVSLNHNCEAEITYRMILRDPDNSDLCSPNGPQAYKVVVMDEEGVEIPTSPMITCEYTGRTLLVKVKHWYSGNSCWSKIVVEDKNAPTLACKSVDLWCTQNAAPTSEGGDAPVPSMMDACAESCQTMTLTYVDTDSTFYSCETIENGIIGTIDRTWTACDNLGNCRICVQRITIKMPNFDDLQYPSDLTGESALSCGDCDPTDLSCTGMPTLDKNNLDHPLCNLQIDYTDAITNQICEGSYTIERMWAIQNTCTKKTHNYKQLIEIVDRTPPVIICADGATVVATPHQTPNSCLANVLIPGATITDNCSSIENIEVITKVYKIDSVGKKWLMAREENANGGFEMEAAFGNYEVYYQAVDACGNVSNNLDNACKFTVEDNIPPTPVCNALTKLTLDRDGKGIIFAESFDNGSFDNCCIESFLVRRMDELDGDFGESVAFSCEDAAESRMVVLQITDCHGNSSICMIEVIIDSKSPPTIVSCAENITVNCSADLSLDQIRDSLLTPPTTQQDCGSGNLLTQVMVKQDFRNECGIGAVIFEWQVTDAAGNGPATCEQLVAFVDDTPIVLILPEDFTIETCVTSIEELTPERTGNVTVGGQDCELVEVLFTDAEITGDLSCRSFTRTWVITNLCEENGTTEHVQTIEIKDTEAPIIDCNGEFFDICLDSGECSRSFNVDGVTISDCSNAVMVRADWTFTPAAVCTGEVQTGSVEAAGDGFVTPAFGPGQLWINFYATDACGNESVCNRDYTIIDCEAPEIICLPGLNLNLDTNGEVEVWANDFHQEIIDNCAECYEEEDYIFSFSQDTSETVRFYGCSDLGVKTAQIWITDAYGNQNFCPVSFIIKGGGICDGLGQDTTATPPQGGMAGINGKIFLEDGETVEAVSVMAENHLAEMMDEQTTDATGTYAFEFQRSANVVIHPAKNDDVLNGVTTYDILQLRKHILGYAELTSPYQLIAADVNHSNAITTADIVALRKVILQVDENFQNNTAWRFIRANHVFANPKNPFAEEMPEKATIAELTQEMEVNFVAIKIGDLNGNAKGQRLSQEAPQARNAQRVNFSLIEKNIAPNTVETITFTLAKKELQAVQMTLNFDPNLVEIINIPTNEQFSDTNFGTQLLPRGVLTMSWETPANTNELLHFQLKVSAKRPTAVSELFTINSSVTPAVAYDGQGNAYAIDLAVSETDYDFELLQNQPNPFQKATTIRFTLPAKSQGKLTILDSTGRTLKSIEQAFAKGINEVKIDDLQQVGLLYYQLETDFGIQTQKMIRM